MRDAININGNCLFVLTVSCLTSLIRKHLSAPPCGGFMVLNEGHIGGLGLSIDVEALLELQPINEMPIEMFFLLKRLLPNS